MSNKKNQKTIIIGLAIAMIFVLVGVFVLSYSYETLDKQAEALGAEEQPIFNPPFADYTIAGMDSTVGSLIVGIAGTLILFGAGLGVAKILSKRKVQK